MASLARIASPDVDRPVKKRKKYTRSATGCQTCRVQRVKCPEGPVAADGKKVACRRCWETDTLCMYPVNGKTVRQPGTSQEHRWARASDVDYWNTRSQNAGQSSAVVSPDADSNGWDLETILGTGRSGSQTLPTTDTLTYPTLPEYGGSRLETAASCSTALPFPLRPTSASSSTIAFDPTVCAPQSSMGTQSSHSFLQWLMELSQPSPPPMLNTFSLTSVLALEADDSVRPVVSYFENEGCNEIVSASRSKHNWLFVHLFPRLFATLSLTPAGQDTVQGLMREWLRDCFVHISYVHRGNVDADPARALIWKSETEKARQRANRALLRAKVRFPNGQWKTEEYLMGFFVRCMAEMLSSNRLVIDDSTAFELPPESASSIYPILRDCIALYSTVDHASKAFGPGLSRRARFSMPPEGPDWVERFVGFSRQTVIRQGEVASLLFDRQTLLQNGQADGVGATLLRSQAEKLLRDLGNVSNWGEHEDDVTCPDRIRRGNGAMRAALQTLLLCEVLEVELEDERLLHAKEVAMELVGDAEASSLGGFQWALTILAVYTRDRETRTRLQDLIHHALSLSFGAGYLGTDEVLSLCWEVLDSNGYYHHGIAPWREALAASERTIFL